MTSFGQYQDALLVKVTDVSDAVNGNGNLKVSIEEGGATGGDASATNQLAMLTDLASIDTTTQSTDAKLTDGTQKARIFGLDPSNNQVQMSVENGGKLQVQVVGSNDINGGTPHRHLTIDANGRTLTVPHMTSTNTAIGTTNTLLNAGLPSSLTASGNLKVSIEEGSSGGGDASASNQTLQLTQATNTNTKLDTLNGKVTQGEGDIASGGNGLQQILCYGKDQSGNLDPLNVDSNGHLKITINDIESGIINPINVASKHANAYLELMSGGSTTIGGTPLLTSAHTLSAGAGSSGSVSPITIYVHFGAGTSDSSFTVEVHKSYDGTVYFVDTNFTFSPVGSNTNSPPTVEPAVVSNGNTDGRFIKVKITNNSETNPTSVDVIVIERQ